MGGVPECMRRARARERLGVGGMGGEREVRSASPSPSQPARWRSHYDHALFTDEETDAQEEVTSPRAPCW